MQQHENFEEEQQEFIIGNPDTANWAVGRIKEERARRDIYIEAAQAHIQRLQDQIKEAEEKCENATRFLLFRLDEYLDLLPFKKTKTQQSFDLPAGKLVRKLPSIDYVRDNDKLTSALAGTDYVEMKPSLKWAELKKSLTVVDGIVMLQTTGEVLDGIGLEEKPAMFDVK